MTVIDIVNPGAVEQKVTALRSRMLDKLGKQAQIVNANDDWVEGRQPVPKATAKNSDLYRHFQQMATTNLLEPACRALADRLAVTDIRCVDDDVAALAWDIWQASEMNANQSAFYLASLSGGIGYLSVAMPSTGLPVIAPEHGAEVTHFYKPGSLREVASGIKVFLDQDNQLAVMEMVAPALTPGVGLRWTATVREGVDLASLQWGSPVEFDNAPNVVPFVPLLNKKTIRGGWHSEIRDAIPIQRRINQTQMNILVAGETVAFPQRWAVGLEQVFDANGEEIRPFKSGADGLWTSTNPDVKFGQFAESQFTGYMEMVRKDAEHLSVVLGLPLYTFASSLVVPPSGEALSAFDAQMVRRVRALQRTAGEAVEDSLRIALARMGVSGAVLDTLELKWADPRVRSDAAVADWVVKVGDRIPDEALWEGMGFERGDIDRMRGQMAAKQFEQLALQVSEQQPSSDDESLSKAA